MFVKKKREDYEKLKKFKDTKEKIMEKNLKEKLTKQTFYHEPQEVFELSISKKKKTAEELTNPKTTGKTKLRKTIPEGLENYDETTQRGNELFTRLIDSNVINDSFAKVLAGPSSSKNKNQFDWTHIDKNIIGINPHNPKKVIPKKKN